MVFLEGTDTHTPQVDVPALARPSCPTPHPLRGGTQSGLEADFKPAAMGQHANNGRRARAHSKSSGVGWQPSSRALALHLQTILPERPSCQPLRCVASCDCRLSTWVRLSSSRPMGVGTSKPAPTHARVPRIRLAATLEWVCSTVMGVAYGAIR